jgi:hypothetical protein
MGETETILKSETETEKAVNNHETNSPPRQEEGLLESLEEGLAGLGGKVAKTLAGLESRAASLVGLAPAPGSEGAMRSEFSVPLLESLNGKRQSFPRAWSQNY